MGKFAKMVGDPRIGYIFNQCRKMGLWEPLEKSEAKMSFTLNGRMLYFKNSKQYKLFRVLFDNVKKAGMDIDEFLDSMPNVVKINENKNILNMKKVIRLTENDLRGIIKSSVSKILREGAFDYVPSASDYEGIADDNFDLDNYDGFYDYDNLGDYEPEMDDYGIDPSIMTDIDPDNLSDEDLSVDFNESSRRLGRIIRESVNNVLKKKR
jgi:hypothetical protein